MKYVLPAFLALILSASCNNSEENKSSTENNIENSSGDTSGTSDTRLVDFSGCYISIMGRDTFATHLSQAGEEVTGRLSFDNFEKDASSGTVNGRVDGNIIKLSYVFQSEGMQSVMDVFFKAAGDSLLRGVGEMNTRGDTAFFVDPNNVRYEGPAFKKIACENLNEKYRTK